MATCRWLPQSFLDGVGGSSSAWGRTMFCLKALDQQYVMGSGNSLGREMGCWEIAALLFWREVAALAER